MKQEILSLSKKFISIKSFADGPQNLERVLEVALSYLQKYTIERFERKGTKSLLIYNVAKRPKRFKILFNVHLDILPGKTNQYKPLIKGNRLYGTGALDMKSNAACMILLFKEIADKVKIPLALQLTTDEEIGGFNGTKYQIEKGVRADFVIAGETTNFDIVNKSKGILQLRISCKGKTAHGAYPWRGENAIWKMNKFLNTLSKLYPVPKSEEWITTINLSKIQTNNNAFNKIPDDCEILLDIRFVPEDKDKVLRNLKNILPKKFHLDILMNEPAKYVDENNAYIKLLQQTAKEITKKNIILRGANGSSDARHFTRVGYPGIEFGAVGEGIGSDEEWINIKSLEQYYQILKSFLLSLN